MIMMEIRNQCGTIPHFKFSPSGLCGDAGTTNDRNLEIFEELVGR